MPFHFGPHPPHLFGILAFHHLSIELYVTDYLYQIPILSLIQHMIVPTERERAGYDYGCLWHLVISI